MSSSKSRSRSTKRKRIKVRNGRSARSKRTNVIVFKVVEPIVQCLLIVAFVFCEDDGFCQGFFYTSIVYTLIGLQIFSSILNLFFDRENFGILIRERLAFLIVIIPYVIFYHTKHVADNASVPFGFGVIPWIYTVLNVGILILAFWYNYISFREMKSLMKSSEDEQVW